MCSGPASSYVQPKRAIIRDEYGDESAIAVGETPSPPVRSGRLLVRVVAASIGHDVWHTLTGLPLASRLVFGLRGPRSKQLGGDFAGVAAAILETAGRRPTAELREALAPGGTAVLVGGEGGGRLFGGFGRELFAGPVARLAGKHIRGVVASTPGDVTADLLDHVAAQRLRPAIHAQLPMTDAAEGIRMMRAGRLGGKIALIGPLS